MDLNNSYEEIDTRLASGWYVDSVGINKKKNYKTKEVSFKISKKVITSDTKVFNTFTEGMQNIVTMYIENRF